MFGRVRYAAKASAGRCSCSASVCTTTAGTRSGSVRKVPKKRRVQSCGTPEFVGGASARGQEVAIGCAQVKEPGQLFGAGLVGVAAEAGGLLVTEEFYGHGPGRRERISQMAHGAAIKPEQPAGKRRAATGLEILADAEVEQPVFLGHPVVRVEHGGQVPGNARPGSVRKPDVAKA